MTGEEEEEGRNSEVGEWPFVVGEENLARGLGI